MSTVGITCPFCCKAIEGPGLVAGARIQCPRCRAAFTVKPEDLLAAALAVSPAPSPAPAPDQASPRLPLVWLLAAAGGAAVLLLLATVGVVLLLGGRRRPQVASAPPTLPAPSAVQPDPEPVEAPAPTDSKPPREALPPPASRPPVLPHEPPPLKAPPDLRDKVVGAIDRGVAFLRRAQADDGSWRYADDTGVYFPDPGHATVGWPVGDELNAKGMRAPWHDTFPVGHAAFAGLALLECDVPAADPQVLNAAKYVRSHLSGLQLTYELALAVLFLDRLGDPEDEARIQALARQLLAAQTPAGGWNYRCPVLPPADDSNYWLALQANRPTSALELIAAQPGDAGVRQGGRDADAASKALDALPPALRSTVALQPPVTDDAFPPGDISDNSNTQFALLALWVAGRHDVPVQRALVRTARRFRLSQRADGEWSYTFQPKGDQPGRPAMTAAGLLGLAVGYGASAGLKGDAPPHEAGSDGAVDRGMEALRRRLDPHPNNPLDLYLLWSVERVGVLYNRRTIGDVEWYPWGADPLVEYQQADGSWRPGFAGATRVNCTCFALLFLKRANLVRDLSTKLEFLSEVKPQSPGSSDTKNPKP